MRANDDIPEDEMLLAEAIAAAKAKNKRWARDRPFVDKNGDSTTPGRAYAVCALGALHLAGRIDMSNRVLAPFEDDRFSNVIYGNDLPDPDAANPRFASEWQCDPRDRGESLGWAFRCFMTQEEP